MTQVSSSFTREQKRMATYTREPIQDGTAFRVRHMLRKRTLLHRQTVRTAAERRNGFPRKATSLNFRPFRIGCWNTTKRTRNSSGRSRVEMKSHHLSVAA